MIDLMIKLFISQVPLNIRLRFCAVDDHLEQLPPVTDTDHTDILYICYAKSSSVLRHKSIKQMLFVRYFF